MPQDTEFRRHAVWAGVLFIIATTALIPASMLYGPPFAAAPLLPSVAAAHARIGLGVLVEMAAIISIPLIAVALYPVFARVSLVAAVGYVAFRLFEAVLFAANEILRMNVVLLGEAARNNPGIDPAALELWARALVNADVWGGASGPIYNLVFVTGMLILNATLWRARLVPRLISGWGLLSAVTLGAIAMVALTGPVPEAIALPLILPLAAQEMVLAVWLIAKGFNMARLPT